MVAWSCRPRFPDVAVTRISGIRRAEWFADYFQQNWEKLCAHPQVSVWVDPEREDYLIVRHGEKDSQTGELQSVVWDWGVHPGPFMQALQERARQRGDHYLVVQHLEGGHNPWPELGFLPELRRVISPSRSEWPAGDYQVRPAESRDLFFMANLHTQGSQFYIPAQRRVDASALVSKTMNYYLGLDLSSKSQMTGFVICENSVPFGYILYKLGHRLDVSHAPAAYLYDLNLKADKRGKSAAGQLGRHSLAELATRGIEFVIGDISADNQLGYAAATRAGHFVLESSRWGLPLQGTLPSQPQHTDPASPGH